MRIQPPLRTLLVASALLGGCSFFDASLYQDGALPDFPVADRCDVASAVPDATGGMHGIVDLTGSRDDFDDLGSCVDNTRTPGADGFIQVTMQAGEKWHFHAKVLDGVGDPALYVLDTCDARSCQFGAGTDICGSGEDEHFSFIAQRSATYFIGLDDKGSSGGRYDLLALHAICGNGDAQHSEGCDDGNTRPGDGCDEGCRFELAPGDAEHEPNDDFTGSNRPILTGGAGSVTGVVEGRCDPDFYALQVAEGGAVAVQVTTMTGAACADSAPMSVLEIIGLDGIHPLGAGTIVPGSGCPSIDGEDFATNMPAGVYYVRLSAPEPDARLPYRISFQVTDPP